mmetsp:Transcript_9585/g.20353  ORF Transcript_9585/g.20353 Transcript_9585/m.20353 type:complete len:278 (-) Transcript_9585:859-1692(-)
MTRTNIDSYPLSPIPNSNTSLPGRKSIRHCKRPNTRPSCTCTRSPSRRPRLRPHRPWRGCIPEDTGAPGDRRWVRTSDPGFRDTIPNRPIPNWNTGLRERKSTRRCKRPRNSRICTRRPCFRRRRRDLRPGRRGYRRGRRGRDIRGCREKRWEGKWGRCRRCRIPGRSRLGILLGVRGRIVGRMNGRERCIRRPGYRRWRLGLLRRKAFRGRIPGDSPENRRNWGHHHHRRFPKRRLRCWSSRWIRIRRRRSRDLESRRIRRSGLRRRRPRPSYRWR